MSVDRQQMLETAERLNQQMADGIPYTWETLEQALSFVTEKRDRGIHGRICYFAAFRLLGKDFLKNVGSGQCLSGRMVLPLGTAAVFPSGSVRASAGSSSGRRGIYRSGSRSGRSPRRIIRRG